LATVQDVTAETERVRIAALTSDYLAGQIPIQYPLGRRLRWPGSPLPSFADGLGETDGSPL
jgi:hypothetical protein